VHRAPRRYLPQTRPTRTGKRLADKLWPPLIAEHFAATQIWLSSAQPLIRNREPAGIGAPGRNRPLPVTPAPRLKEWSC
jgi:hypothetical protein